MIGQRFYRLLVLARCTVKPQTHKRLCVCDCGTFKIISKYNLRSGDTKSCGCLHREITGRINKTHSMNGSPEYVSWINMKARCTNSKNKYFRNYGGRGITVCDKWLHSFENFYSDMGVKPFHKAEIDRIDNNKGYSPDNCEWRSSKQNNRNRNNNIHLTHNGETLLLVEWSEKCNIPYSTLMYRIKREWPTEKALTQPLRTALITTYRKKLKELS